MQRRRLLKVGLATSAVLALAAGATWWVTEAPRDGAGRLSPAARRLFSAVASAVLAGALPEEPSARERALRAWMERLESTITGMPPAVQGELDQLLLLLDSAPGRWGLAGLAVPWHEAAADQVHDALQGMRQSTMAVRQQVFHALRDLCNAAYFAAPQAWSTLGYPGPLKV